MIKSKEWIKQCLTVKSSQKFVIFHHFVNNFCTLFDEFRKGMKKVNFGISEYVSKDRERKIIKYISHVNKLFSKVIIKNQQKYVIFIWTKLIK